MMYRVVVLFLLSLSLATSPAFAATYYVAPEGSDSSAGTLSSPWQSFSRALGVMQAGDTLIAKDGTYNQTISKIPSGQSWEKPVTVKALNPRKAIIRPSTTVNEALSISYGDGKIPRTYISVEGFVWDCVNTRYRCVHIAGELDEKNIIDVQHIRIVNNEIKNAGEVLRASQTEADYTTRGAQGILNSRADDISYINNDIHDNGVTDYDHGIYQGGGNNILMEGNRIHHNRGSGIKIGWTGKTKDNIARNNIVYDNNTAWTFGNKYGSKQQGRGISTHYSTGTQIYNNIVIGPHTAGIDVIYVVSNANVYNNTVVVTGSNATSRGITVGGNDGSTSLLVTNTQIKNNIVYQQNTRSPTTTNTAIQIGFVASNTTVANNLVYGTNTLVSKETTYPVTISGTLVKDPLFVDVTARDVRLKPSSPAINAGISLSTITTDYAFSVRPAGSAFDIGAYEYGGNGITPTVKPSQKSGDANNDGMVSGADFTIWLREYREKTGSFSDFNKDGKVDGIDFVILQQNYGK